MLWHGALFGIYCMSLLSTGLSYFRRKVRATSRPRTTQNHGCALLEPLEGRTLLAATPVVVDSVTADNRGYVQVRFSKALLANTVTNSTVKILVAGADKKIGTTDDRTATATLLLNKTKNVLTIRAKLAADTTYRVKLL